MMSGFGDAATPRPDSVLLMQELVLDYIVALVAKSTEVAHANRRERPDETDIKFIIRKEPRKLKRVRYLLEMKSEIKKAVKIEADEYIAAPPGKPQ